MDINFKIPINCFIGFHANQTEVKGKVSHQQSKNPPPGGAGPSSGVDGGGGRSIAEITTNVR
jgi:hypothetical protein